MILSYLPLSSLRESPELDRGGWARLDVSDLVLNPNYDSSNEGGASAAYAPCSWCTEGTASGEYVVVADNRHYCVCSTCWGRSAAYVELRGAGLAHENALACLAGTSSQYREEEAEES